MMNGLSQEFQNQFVMMGLKMIRLKEFVFHQVFAELFFAISPFGYRKKLYVHIPVNIEDIVKSGKLCKPTEEQVYDVSTTNEFWVKKKVKMKCIGRISIGYKTNYWGK